MVDDNRLDRLIRVAKDSRSDSLTVHQAIAALDEKQDGEPVTRIALLVDDPTSDTWPAAEVHGSGKRSNGKPSNWTCPR